MDTVGKEAMGLRCSFTKEAGAASSCLQGEVNRDTKGDVVEIPCELEIGHTCEKLTHHSFDFLDFSSQPLLRRLFRHL